MTIDFRSKEFLILYVLLILCGIGLTLTTVRGAFIIDEINYMVNAIGLREGKLTVVGTENISPSKELFYFDPDSYNRIALSTPVSSLAPPLYAPLALPFLLLEWRGLVLLNTLSFLLTAFLIFVYVRRLSRTPFTAWLGLSYFIVGGFAIEYAQGVWPHMLSVLLCFGSMYLLSLVWEGKNAPLALAGGFLIGIACGVREQNIFVAACLGVTLLIWGRKRLTSATLYAAGIAVPLAISATWNFFRLGYWHPIPKANTYASLVAGQAHTYSWLQPLKVFWVKVVDFSSYSVFGNPAEFIDYSREASTGAYLVGGIVKKALIQSSPWIGLVIILLIVVWFKNTGGSDVTRKNIRAISVVVVSTLVMFALAGFRSDGLSFNQRYLHEIVPFAAVAIALSIDHLSLSRNNLLLGFLGMVLAFAMMLISCSREFQHIVILRLPLIIAITLILGWFFLRRNILLHIFEFALGASLGWSLCAQSIDVMTSRGIRVTNARDLNVLEVTIPDHSALFTYWGRQKAAAGPLQLNKDVLILDAWADNGEDAPKLARELLVKRTAVFIEGSGMPEAIVERIKGDDSLAVVVTNPFLVYKFVLEARDKQSAKSAAIR